MPFRFLDHPADIRVECFGKTWDELFRSAAEALYAVALSTTKKGTTANRSVQIDSETEEETIVRWVQELNYLLESEGFVATEFIFARAEALSVRAHLRGYICSPEERDREIKAATYHNLRVSRSELGLHAEIILDL